MSDARLVVDVLVAVNATTERHFLSSTGISDWGYTVAISKRRLGGGVNVTVTAQNLQGGVASALTRVEP